MTDPDVKRLARRINRMGRDTRAMARASQAAFRSVNLADGDLAFYDDDGREVLVIGQNDDGTFTFDANNPDAPPIPSAPDVEGFIDSIAITYDGTFEDADVPADLAYFEIHASHDPDFFADDTTQIGTFTSINGGTFNFPTTAAEGEWLFAIQAVNRSGIESDKSFEVAGTAVAGGGGGTDGNPPSSSPAAVLEPLGIGGLLVSWDPIANADPVTYDVYLDDVNPPVELATSTINTAMPFVSLPDGSPFVEGTTYYAAVVARDDDGAAAMGVSGSAQVIAKVDYGQMAQDIIDDINAASAQAAAAQTTADGKNTVYYTTPVAPPGGFVIGDTWFDNGTIKKWGYTPNLVTNGDFEPPSDTAGWNGFGAALSISTFEPYTGTQCLRVAADGGTFGIATYSPDIPVEQGKTYTLSARIRHGGGGVQGKYAQLLWINSGGGAITADNGTNIQGTPNGFADGLSVATGMPPVDAVSVRVRLIMDNTSLAGDIMNADTVSMVGLGWYPVTIGSPSIADSAVISSKIANTAVDASKIADNAVTTTKINNLAVTNAKIGSAAVTTAKIGNAAITTALIANLAVGSAQIADAAILSAKIADAAIINAKIADAAITDAKIANLDAGKITTGFLAAGRIAADTIVASMIAAGQIGADELAANSVIAGKIAANAVTATTIAANAITTVKIAAGAVTATQIAAGAVSADKLTATAIDGKTITGALIRTAASGARVEVSDSGGTFADNDVRFYTGGAIETTSGYIGSYASPSGDTVTTTVASPQAGTAGVSEIDLSSTTFSNQISLIVLKSDEVDVWGELVTGPIYAENSIRSPKDIRTNADGSTAGGLYDEVWIDGGGTGATINNLGRIIRSGSSQRFKHDIRELTLAQAERLYEAIAVSFLWNEDMGMGTRRGIGFIAEQLKAAGLDILVNYDKDGQVFGINFDGVVAGLSVLVKNLHSRVVALEGGA